MYLGWIDYGVLTLLLCECGQTQLLSMNFFGRILYRFIRWYRYISWLHTFTTTHCKWVSYWWWPHRCEDLFLLRKHQIRLIFALQVLPTAMSLLASVTSAATLLGVPVEVYTYGTMYLYYSKYIVIKRQYSSLYIVRRLELEFRVRLNLLYYGSPVPYEIS